MCLLASTDFHRKCISQKVLCFCTVFIWMSLCSFCVFNLSSVLYFLQHSTWMALYRLLVLMYIKNLLTRSLGWRRVVYSVAGVSLTLWLLLVFCVQCFVEFCWSWSAQWTTHDHLQCTSCVWTREHSGISPARFLAKCRKRWLNLNSFCYILHCLLFSLCILCCFVCEVIGCEDLLRNDIDCVR